MLGLADLHALCRFATLPTQACLALVTYSPPQTRRNCGNLKPLPYAAPDRMIRGVTIKLVPPTNSLHTVQPPVTEQVSEAAINCSAVDGARRRIRDSAISWMAGT
jgi:hypothetical protein